jgi:hypothetical protein
LSSANPACPASLRWTGPCYLVALALFCGLWFEFSIHTAATWLAFPQFLGSVGAMFVLPGVMLLRWLRLRPALVETLAVAACLGMAATCTLYGVLAWLGVPALLWLWLLIALWQARPLRWRFWGGAAPLRPEHMLLLLALAAAWLPILVIGFYCRNLSLTGDGGMSYFAFPPDIALHTAIAGELTHTVPPQVPYLSGQPLSYHLGMDMVTAVLARFGGLPVPDLVARFCPLLFVTVDILAIFSLGRRFTGSGKAGVVIAFLTILGEDFSFVPGILQSNPDFWSDIYFRAPTIYSSYFFNPMGMGLGFLFAGLFCLHRAEAEARPGWFVAAGLCLAALVEIKIFLFVLLCLAILAAALLELVLFRRTFYLRFGLYLLVLSLPLGLFIFFTNSSGGGIAWTFSSGLESYVTPAAAAMGLPAAGAPMVLLLPLYLAGVFGFRILGAGQLVKALKPARENSFASLLAIFVLLGPVLTLTGKIVPRTDPASYDNAVWFLCASKFVAPIFAVTALSRFWAGGGLRRRLALIAIVAAISLPSSLQYAVKNASSWQPLYWNPAQIAAISALNRLASPGQVVLPAAPGIDSLLMTMTALRLPYADFPYIAALASREMAAARLRDIHGFRQSWAANVLDSGILHRYGVNWVIAPPGISPPMQQRNLLALEPAFSNAAFAIYRVRPVPAQVTARAGGPP